MTREEAIELLVNATYSDEWQGNNALQTAHSMAIEALRQAMTREEAIKELVNIIFGMNSEPEFTELTGTNDVEVGDILYCKETRCYYMVTAKDRSSITILNYAGNTYVHNIYDPHRTYFKTILHVGSFEHILNELERLSNE